MSGGKHLGRGSQKPVLPDDGMLRIYSMRFCPYAQRAHLVLNAKNIPYHTVYINLTEKPEWLTEVSPLGKVPALQLVNEPGQPILIESLIIADYLDEKYPEIQLYPKDPLQKAQDRILIERLNPLVGAIYKVLVNPGPVSTDVMNNIFSLMNIYEKELIARGTPFFAGVKPGMLDYMIWPWFERLATFKYLVGDKYDLDNQNFDKLINWRDLMVNDPAVKSFFVSGEMHAKFLETRRTGNPDYDMLISTNKRQRNN